MTRFANLAVSAATALSIALAPAQANAAPDGEDIARGLAGLLVLGIVAKAASDRNDRRTRSRTVTNNRNVYEFDSIDNRNRRIIEGDLRRIDGPKRGRGYKKARLPDRCLRIVDTGRRDRLVYGSRCLNRSFKHASKLPDRCERLVRTRRGLRTVYAARCLARDGWRVARR